MRFSDSSIPLSSQRNSTSNGQQYLAALGPALRDIVAKKKTSITIREAPKMDNDSVVSEVEKYINILTASMGQLLCINELVTINT